MKYNKLCEGQTHAEMAEACRGQAYAYNIIIIKQKTYFKKNYKKCYYYYTHH